MKGESIRQLSFLRERGASTAELVYGNMDIFRKLALIINTTKEQMEQRIINDSVPQLYEDKTYFAYTLTQLIKINISAAIDRGELCLKKARYYQCDFFVIEGVMSIYIKKLNKAGLPSYNESFASEKRMQNDEKLPCLFLGPRFNDDGVIGGVCASITTGSHNSYLVAEIDLSMSNSEQKVREIVYNDINSDDICTPKEDIVKVKERKVN